MPNNKKKQNPLLLFHFSEAEACALIFSLQLPVSSLWRCSALEVIRTSEFHYLDGDEKEGGPGEIILKEIRNYLIKEKRH
jgi:hypothetical protein